MIMMFDQSVHYLFYMKYIVSIVRPHDNVSNIGSQSQIGIMPTKMIENGTQVKEAVQYLEDIKRDGLCRILRRFS
jgi:hypothetical protein